MNYGDAYTKVSSALMEGEVHNLAVAYTQSDDFSKLKHSIAADYQKFYNIEFGVLRGAVQMTVEQFLFAMLVNSPNMKDAVAFENEADAENEGFFWIDSIEKWLKLMF